MKTHSKSPRRGRVVRAFTLVETVIAIGIVSTVMVALLGMMPEGMNMIRQAGQRTVGVRIAQELIGRIQLADFDEVSSFDNNVYHFDDMGTEVTSGDQRKIYTAKIEVSALEHRLPGAAQPSKVLKNVVIKVSDSLTQVDFSDEGAGRSYLRYATNIVDLSDKQR